MSRSTVLHEWKLNTAIAKLLGNLEAADTDQIVRAINSKIMLAQFADTSAKTHRVEAGQLLLELRCRKEDEGVDWWSFVKDNIHHRSKKDIMKLMALARADDPEAAAEAERERNRECKQLSRKYQQNQPVADVSDQSNVVEFPTRQSKIEYILSLIESLDDQEREVLRQRCEETWSW